MPLFEYRCNVCGKTTERLFPRAEAAAVSIISSDVPNHLGGFCAQWRVPSVASFALKGAGFHRNDYPKGS